MASIFCSVCDPKYVSFINFLLDFCITDDILYAIWIIVKKLLDFKLSISGQIYMCIRLVFLAWSHLVKCFIINLYLFLGKSALWQWYSLVHNVSQIITVSIKLVLSIKQVGTGLALPPMNRMWPCFLYAHLHQDISWIPYRYHEVLLSLEFTMKS